MKFTKKIPMALSGLSLSLLVLGNLLQPYGDSIRAFCGILSAIILLLFLLKLIFDTENVKEEIKNPIVASIFPTSTMALMFLCVYIKPFFGFAVILWYIAVILHVLIMLFFAKRFLSDFKLPTVFPSWFVTAVGIVVVSVTSPAMNAKPLGRVIFYIGLLLYVVLLPIVIKRMATLKNIPESARPTVAIFTAPMSLCIVGYFSSFENLNAALIYVMVVVALISYVYVTINMVSLLKLKFYPTYAAFTFPHAVSAVAFKTANKFLSDNGQFSLGFLVKASEYIAVIVVVYVCARYVMFFMSTPKDKA